VTLNLELMLVCIMNAVFIGAAGLGSSAPDEFLFDINKIWGGYFVYV
jgi:hypothetical protein